MVFRNHLVIIVVSVLIIFGSCCTLLAETVRLSAAASMTNVVKELITVFSNDNREITIIPNFGPSGGLARQIERGAPADLFISANLKWVEYLKKQRLIIAETEQVFASTRLVFIGHTDRVQQLADITALQRIGIGSPKSVPAGQYAEQALKQAGLWEQLQDEARLVLAKDVRQALIYADRGETEGSFVYATDALLARSAKVLFTVDPQLHDPISYTLAITTEAADKKATARFISFVTSPDGAAILVKHGFTQP